ncbi:ERV/ALR sulfhydryl oxidase domain-containing protein [Dipodascopsis uninucleata]
MVEVHRGLSEQHSTARYSGAYEIKNLMMAKLLGFRKSGSSILVSLAVMLVLLVVISLNSSKNIDGITSRTRSPQRPTIKKQDRFGSSGVDDIAMAGDYDPLSVPIPASTQKLSQGAPIMPHLGNETIKAELGRSTWRLLHTILARYPEKPSTDEREALASYIYLLARVYPCGECAQHFQKLLKKYPPQTSSRKAAEMWGCYIHNQVNERLNKEIFDCSKISETYDCGCGEERTQDDLGDEQSTEATNKFASVEEKLKGIHIESKENLVTGG